MRHKKQQFYIDDFTSGTKWLMFAVCYAALKLDKLIKIFSVKQTSGYFNDNLKQFLCKDLFNCTWFTFETDWRSGLKSVLIHRGEWSTICWPMLIHWSITFSSTCWRQVNSQTKTKENPEMIRVTILMKVRIDVAEGVHRCSRQWFLCKIL